MDNATAIRTAREMTGVSQSELARRIGTSQPTLCAYERGSRPASRATTRKILHALGLEQPRDRLRHRKREVVEVFQRFHARDVRVVGSVARRDDDIDSNIDFIATFERGVSLFDLEALRLELEVLLGCEVDVIADGPWLREDDRYRDFRTGAVPV